MMSSAMIGAPSAPDAGRGAMQVGSARAASNALNPPASNAPVIPDRTSPLPAVASHDVPVGLTRVNPSGAQITVVEPFSNTVAPSCRAACGRSAAAALDVCAGVRHRARARG